PVALSGSLQSPRRGRAQSGKDRIVIVRARTVVTMDGAPITDGAVRVHRNRIVELGKFSQLAELSTAPGTRDEIVDLGEHILLPGLINALLLLYFTFLPRRIAP